MGDAGLPAGLREGAGSRRYLQWDGQPWAAAPRGCQSPASWHTDGPINMVPGKGASQHQQVLVSIPATAFPSGRRQGEGRAGVSVPARRQEAGKLAWINLFTPLLAPVFIEGLSGLGSILVFPQN